MASLSPFSSSVDHLATYRESYLYSPHGSAIMQGLEVPVGVPPLNLSFGDGTLSVEDWREVILSSAAPPPPLGVDLMPCGAPSGLHAPRAHAGLPVCCEHALFLDARLPSPHSVPELGLDAARPEPEEGADIVLSPAAVAVLAAEVVLAPEQEPVAPEQEPLAAGAGEPVAPPAGAPEEGPQDWCFSATIPEMGEELLIHHPRVLLHLLRFVKTYNELAPQGEDIRLPLLSQDMRDYIFSHSSIINPPPEFANEVADLRELVNALAPQLQGWRAPEAAVEGGRQGAGWCVALTADHLALRLDMRHPRVLLHFLRFVETYNELAAWEATINIPLFQEFDLRGLQDHDDMRAPPPEFQAEAQELLLRAERNSCQCSNCCPDAYDDESDGSRSPYSYYGRD